MMVHSLLNGEAAPHFIRVQQDRKFHLRSFEAEILASWKKIDSHFYSIRWEEVHSLEIEEITLKSDKEAQLLIDLIERATGLAELILTAPKFSFREGVTTSDRICKNLLYAAYRQVGMNYHLTALTLRHFQQLALTALTIPAKATSLNSLRVFQCGLTDEDIEPLCRVINSIGQFKVLTLETDKLTSSGFSEFCSNIEQHVHIDTLCFDGKSLSRLPSGLLVDIAGLCRRVGLQEITGLCSPMRVWDEETVLRFYNALKQVAVPPLLTTDSECNICFHNVALKVSIAHRKLYLQRQSRLSELEATFSTDITSNNP